jgi:ABC-2 type transport system permease protein
MWRTVLNLEWRILRRDRAAIAVLVMFSLFLLVAALAGGHHASVLSSGLDRSQSVETRRIKSLHDQLQGLESSSRPLGARDPRDPVWMGKEGAARLAVLPPAPLAPIAVGQRDLRPQAVRVNSDVHLTSERETETPMSGPTRLMSGAFDPAFLFVVLFPLVIIALSYELLSGERERGTLAMLLSQPVSQRALVLGKAIARAIALSGVTVVFALIGLLVAGAELGTTTAWLHVLLYIVVLIVWALFWFAAAVTVNGMRQSSASNALILVGLWLVLVVVVPGLVHAAVDALHPPPSRMERVHEAREAAQDIERRLAGLRGRHDRNTKAKGYARDVVKTQRELAKRSAPVLDGLREQLRLRQQMLDALRFLSPAIVVQLALEDIAGAGAIRHQNFETQVDTFHHEFRAFFFDRIDRGARVETADLEALPTMTFREEPHSALLSRVLSGVIGLLVAIIALLAAAWRGLRRVDHLAP